MTAALVFLICSCLTLSGHPSTGLVVDARNNVYFVYWGGTWKLDARGQLSRFHASDLHFLAIDSAGRFAAAHIPDALRITPDGSSPALFTFPESPAAFHSDGNLYSVSWVVVAIKRAPRSGRMARTNLEEIPPPCQSKPARSR